MVSCRLLAVFLMTFSSVVFAGSVNVNMSNHAAQFEVGYSVNGNADMQSGFLYNDQSSVIIDTGLVANGGNGGGDQEAASGLSGGGGVKAIAGTIKQSGAGNFVSCIAIGGQVTYSFPEAPAFAVSGEYFTALKITSFGDADRFNQFGLRIEMGPPHAKFFLGYREITFDIIGAGGVSVDKGGYTGIMFSF